MNQGYEQTGRIGPIEVAWPRFGDYCGGLAMAAAFELIEWPFGPFQAAIPAVELRRDLPKADHFAVHVFEGMAKRGCRDAEGTNRLARTPQKLKALAKRTVATESGRPPRRPTRRAASGTAVQDRSEHGAGSAEA